MHTMMRVLLAGLLALSFALSADIRTDVFHCEKIADNDDRLECYDKVAAFYKKQPGSNDVRSTDTGPSSMATDTHRQSATAGPATVAPASDEDSFGLLAKQGSELKTIQSTIVGEFRGWRKGAVIRLANGQKWKVKGSSGGYTKSQNPAVEISRGVFGNFRMKVEGLNSMAKVTRVK